MRRMAFVQKPHRSESISFDGMRDIQAQSKYSQFKANSYLGKKLKKKDVRKLLLSERSFNWFD